VIFSPVSGAVKSAKTDGERESERERETVSQATQLYLYTAPSRSLSRGFFPNFVIHTEKKLSHALIWLVTAAAIRGKERGRGSGGKIQMALAVSFTFDFFRETRLIAF
jgi:hypothetical protein